MQHHSYGELKSKGMIHRVSIILHSPLNHKKMQTDPGKRTKYLYISLMTYNGIGITYYIHQKLNG